MSVSRTEGTHCPLHKGSVAEAVAAEAGVAELGAGVDKWSVQVKTCRHSGASR